MKKSQQPISKIETPRKKLEEIAGLSKHAIAMCRMNKSDAIHDAIVKKVAGRLDSNRYDVYMNVGGNKNVHIKGNYPDVIMAAKGTLKAEFILEVATPKDLTFVNAERKWKKYASEISATPCIVVPKSGEMKAQHLCNRVGLKARLATYDVDTSGDISLTFK